MPIDLASAAGALFTTQGRIDPYPLYRTIQQVAPVLPMAENIVLITGYDECDRLLKDPIFMAGDQYWRDREDESVENPHLAKSLIAASIISLNPPEHRRLRLLLGRAFTPARMTAMTPMLERIVDELVSEMAQKTESVGVIDFMSEFACRLPIRMAGAVLGLSSADVEGLGPLVHDLAVAFELDISGEPLNAANSAAARLRAHLTDIIARRCGQPSADDDLIRSLVAAAPEDFDALIANLLLLLVAGQESPSNLLGNGLRILLDRPELAATLRAAPAGLPAFVEEVLRFDSPVQMTGRWSNQETDLGGHLLPREGYAILMLGAANRDPRFFLHPDEFLTARANNKHLSFAAGSHFCLGAALARLGARIAFHALIREFPGMSLADEPARIDRLSLRGYATLPIRLAAM
ncbi:cytochrome P450 [Amycolatopsis sp. NPDC059090]|uniref:cytochrome P450 n=1 Tax=Amycolatopsis sp. NPDC059090 TaxID=3346723 RepID=UPI003671A5C2